MRATRHRYASSTVRHQLLVGLAVLAGLQLFHLLDVLRYDDTASFPGVLAEPQGIAGVTLTVFAFVFVLWREPAARMATIVASSVVAVGFVLHHGIPVQIGSLTNPYWTPANGNRADWIRWTTVVTIIAVGAFTASTAWRAPPDLLGERR
jgi:hypothetical protein